MLSIKSETQLVFLRGDSGMAESHAVIQTVTNVNQPWRYCTIYLQRFIKSLSYWPELTHHTPKRKNFMCLDENNFETYTQNHGWNMQHISDTKML